MPDDGSQLLTGPGIAPLLEAAVAHAGGRLLRWSLDQVDSSPEKYTTATYRAHVAWSYGERTEMLGVSTRAGDLEPSDANALIFEDGFRRAAVWLYPKDPDLPGLNRAAFPQTMAEILNEHRVLPTPVVAEQVQLTMIGYRPRRRAVVKVEVPSHGATFYTKVLRERFFADIVNKHTILRAAGVPAPEVLATTPDHLLLLRALPGVPLAEAIFDEEAPCKAEQLIGILDAMPPSVAKLERRSAWSDSVQHYARLVEHPMPEIARELEWLVNQISSGLVGLSKGEEPTHGDFHEGQLHVAGGRIAGILDIDTIGPGRRADDLACLVAHLVTIGGMNTEQEERVRALLAAWVPVFDRRVDPVELRLRAAAAIISLATIPYRLQEAGWRRQTEAMIGSATALVRQVV